MQAIFSPASLSDIAALITLINRAYRGPAGKQGWTTEADLLSGRRTDSANLLRLLTEPNSVILTAKQQHNLLACVHLQHSGQLAQFSMFAVEPALQNQGLGKQLLATAETTAQQLWSVDSFIMWVISRRSELLAFYVRRGYCRTGVSQSFPADSDLWQAKVADLRLELLEKTAIKLQNGLNPA